MKDKIKKIIPYAIILILDYYALPILIKDTGTAMLILLIVVPLICFICAIAYGIKQDFSPIFASMAALLFIPSIFIFYNESAWVYAVAYGVIALLGNGIGRIFHKKK